MPTIKFNNATAATNDVFWTEYAADPAAGQPAKMVFNKMTGVDIQPGAWIPQPYEVVQVDPNDPFAPDALAKYKAQQAVPEPIKKGNYDPFVTFQPDLTMSHEELIMAIRAMNLSAKFSGIKDLPRHVQSYFLTDEEFYNGK